MDHPTKTPSLIASTGTTYCCSIAESRIREQKLLSNDFTEAEVIADRKEGDMEYNYFKSAQWSADGTSLLASSADNTVRTFILPPDLLEPHITPINLTPYTSHQHPSPISCVSPYPAYTLTNLTTTLYLSTPSSLPIRLTNALSPTPTSTATYPLISPTTEAYYTPSALLWTSPTTFLAGTECLIAMFDVARNGEGPVSSMPTIPSKRHKMKGGGVGIRGIVSALSLQPTLGGMEVGIEGGMVAAGTWTRWLALYDSAGVGGTVAQWSIASAADDIAGIGGMGITQTCWSSCGRYLYAVERKSNGVLVYDVRGAGKMLAWLEGRNAVTNQRLGIDVFEGAGGMEVWGGDVDGVVKVWEGVGMGEGAVRSSWEWKAHDDPVTSTVIHSSGTVVATCSGQRSSPILDENDGSSENSSDSEEGENDSNGDSDESDQDSEPSTTNLMSSRHPRPLLKIPDNSLKVWSL
ncbi:hypothetical protein BJ875DRAFT_58624 [Amylocarpus encephaloides]|uniref:Uncharacterized protein n=1 Tax=Amylocarpus encephaloides TaxID=45428 RepID=A0A9P7YHC4_9HELO|nr:hypothetical protein BJ875DRAFT_58624 [Amylocarpus encephaloides]